LTCFETCSTCSSDLFDLDDRYVRSLVDELPPDGKLDGFQLRPLLLVALSDELRPDVGRVLEALSAQGFDFKVVSGDNPATVRATVSHLNLPLAHEPVATGDDLATQNPEVRP
jgi:magnesium-transporting ATPase (P-type)